MEKKLLKSRQKTDSAKSQRNSRSSDETISINNRSGNSLSQKQSEVLRLIEENLTLTGRPPTYREIARMMGDLAVGTVQDHVRALERKGYLARPVRPTRQAQSAHSSRQAPRRGAIARGFHLAHQAQALSVPVLGTVPAGRPIEAIEDLRGSIAILARAAGPSDEIFALEVRGESMRDAGILDGDYVVVRKQTEARDGDIVVAMIDGEATVKTLERRGGRVRLLPANPAFEPIELEPGHENLIQGKVIGVQRYL